LLKSNGKMNDKDYMRQAIELARINVAQGGGPFGAVIVKDGEVIARSGNSVTRDNDPTAHAEINCIRDACKKLESFELKGCVIYSSCEPCPMCLSAIYWARLDRLIYASTRQDAALAGFDDDFIYKEIPLANEARSLKCEHLCLNESELPFDDWKSKEDKTEY
jgi:tRNA(Arg) A34 adenosine deaminase TadA